MVGREQVTIILMVFLKYANLNLLLGLKTPWPERGDRKSITKCRLNTISLKYKMKFILLTQCHTRSQNVHSSSRMYVNSKIKFLSMKSILKRKFFVIL